MIPFILSPSIPVCQFPLFTFLSWEREKKTGFTSERKVRRFFSTWQSLPTSQETGAGYQSRCQDWILTEVPPALCKSFQQGELNCFNWFHLMTLHRALDLNWGALREAAAFWRLSRFFIIVIFFYFKASGCFNNGYSSRQLWKGWSKTSARRYSGTQRKKKSW